MPNSVFFTIAAIILIAIGVDVALNAAQVILWLGVKLNDLIEWLAFWR